MIGSSAPLAWLAVPPSARSVRLLPASHVSSFRRIAIGSWRTAADPTVYGTLTLRAEAARERLRAAGIADEARGLTALLVMAVARAFARLPEANALLHWNRLLLRPTVDISVLVPIRRVDEPPRLEPRLLVEADRLEMPELLRRLEVAASAAPAMPRGLLARFGAWTAGWFRPEPGASAWVAEVGALPFDTAYLPLPPGAKVPLVLVPGAPGEVPVVEAGAVGSGWVLSVHASFDHRLLDGWHAAQLATEIRAGFESSGPAIQR
jgi:pyruvate dehydrogenase E2 component (dihydrolipoamide acetyltransferase)